MSVNKTAMQNILQHLFLLLGALSEMGETVAQIWPQVVGIAEFRKSTKMRGSSKAPLGIYSYMAHLEVFIFFT